MNIREYIDSGVIELYVMNALTATEAAEVEALARQYPEIKAEIEETQSVMQLYTQAFAQIPNPELKNKILERLKEDFNEKQDSQIDTTEDLHEIPKTANKTLLSEIHPKNQLLPWVIAGLGLIASLLFYIQYQKITKIQLECEENQKLNELKANKQIADLNFRLDILKSSETKTIPLKSVIKEDKNLEATVYWSASQNATFLSIHNLPEPPAGKQYQLWAIVDKKPVDAGIFEYNLTALLTMKGFNEAEAFAITLEPEGGSTSPSLDKMYVLGTL